MIERDDLFLSFMRGGDLADDQLPRLGVWQPGAETTPVPVDLNDAGRDWIAAIGLPAVFRRGGPSERSEGTIRAGMTERVVATGDELDDRMAKNAERHDRPSGGARRSRGKDNVIKASQAAGQSIERHLDTRGVTQGRWALDGVRTDVDLLLAAVDAERWVDARRILEVVASPTWTGQAATGEISDVEIPADHVTDPTARKMLDAAIRSAVGHPRSRKRWPAGDAPSHKRRRTAYLGLGAGVAAIVAVLAVVIAAGGGGPTLSSHARALRLTGGS